MKYKEKLQLLKYFFIDSYGLMKSIFVYYLRSVRRPSIFSGYHSYYWACKFAQKRSDKWKPKWDQMGKKQGVLPLDDTRLIVCSAMELKFYKKKGFINKKLKPRKAIKKSYYTT